MWKDRERKSGSLYLAKLSESVVGETEEED